MLVTDRFTFGVRWSQIMWTSEYSMFVVHQSCVRRSACATRASSGNNMADREVTSVPRCVYLAW
jgi:hypothetical protein